MECFLCLYCKLVITYTVNIYLYCLQYCVNSEFAVGDDSGIIATLKV